MKTIILIHPPVAKPGEPPAGIARLKGALSQNGYSCSLIDANLHGLLYLLNRPVDSSDPWTSQAAKSVQRHMGELLGGSAFKNINHYNRLVSDLNRILGHAGNHHRAFISLGDYLTPEFSPASSNDLIQCALRPELNPFYDYYTKELVPALKAELPDMIGLSVNFLSQAICAFALIGVLRDRLPGTEIVLGGGLITSWKRLPNWNDPFSGLVDACVDGPGESWFLGEENERPEFYRPDYSDLAENPYFSPGFVLPYNTTCGCYWGRCNFCPEKAEENPYLSIKHQQVLDDLMVMKEETRPALLHFLDNALTPAFVNRLVDNPPGIPWYGYLRFTDHLKDLTFCEQLMESGCRMIKLGLESGDQEVLDQMNKGIDLETVSIVLNNLKRTGIKTYIYLLFGTPYESEESARNTMDFVLDHASAITYINAAIFNMPIAGPDAGLYQTRQHSEGDLSLYVDFAHPLGWDRAHVRRFLDREFRREPQIAEILRRTPKTFTSNHAAFFAW